MAGKSVQSSGTWLGDTLGENGDRFSESNDGGEGRTFVRRPFSRASTAHPPAAHGGYMTLMDIEQGGDKPPKKYPGPKRDR